MKQKLIFAMMCFASAAFSLAGEPASEHGLLTRGKMWVYQKPNVGLYQLDDDTSASYAYPTESVLPQDTLIQGKNCVKTLFSFNFPCCKKNYQVPGCIDLQILDGRAEAIYFEHIYHEADEKVYLYSPHTEAFYLIMDFSLEPGDKLERQCMSGTSENCTVLQKDEIDVAGIKRRRIKFINGEVWVEGIGCHKFTLSMFPNDLLPLPLSGPPFTMAACYEDGECVFTADDFNAPALSSLSEVETDTERNESATVYDLSGRPVQNPRKGRLYIQNHKKVIL